MINLKEISEKIKGQLKGNPNLQIKSINSLEKSVETDIAFSIKENFDYTNINAAALIVKKGSKIQYPNLVYVEEPYIAFAVLLDYFFPAQRFNNQLDPNSQISESAVIGDKVSLGPFSYVGENSYIGDNCEIHSGVIIYPNVKIGNNCLIYSNVVIREHVEIGNNVIIQPGVVIGSDGFGFTRLNDGTPVKIPHKGKVKIGDHCEIGANVCIDRSTIEETVLKDYVKLDNLVHIGHNVRIGKGSAFSALCGISGSVNIGENVIMGGQVGIADHASIGNGAMVAARAGIHGHVKDKAIVAGTPQQDIMSWKRNQAILKNLESYIDRIKLLERKIKELEEKPK